MAQVSYGTITITDTNDVESIIVEYNRNQSTTTPPAQTDSGWSTNRPAWAQGYYIWQRTRTHRSGTQASDDTLGDAVCITGSAGQNGTSITISSIKYAISTTESQPEDSSFTYTSVPTVAEGSWLWTLTTYSNGNKMYTKSKQGASGTSVTVSSVKYAISEEDTIVDEGVYSFRKTGDGKSVGSKEEDVLIGGTVAWNQLAIEINSSNYTLSNATSVSFGNDSVTFTASGTQARITSIFNKSELIYVPSHVYFIDVHAKASASRTFQFQLSVGGSQYFLKDMGVVEEDWTHMTTVVKPTTGDAGKRWVAYSFINSQSEDVCSIKDINVIDLTQMFGSTIADYIYSLEQATAGSGITKLKSWGFFTEDYYPYDSGSLKSVEGLNSHDMVGFNQWDEEWESGKYSEGIKAGDNSKIRCKNFISVLPNTAYYLHATGSLHVSYYDINKNYISAINTGSQERTTPEGCYYMTFNMFNAYGTTYNHDICINLSSSKNGTYEPYEKHSYALDSDLVLRGKPTLVNGELVYDGDRYESSGVVTRKYKELSTFERSGLDSSGKLYKIAQDSALYGEQRSVIRGISNMYPIVDLVAARNNSDNGIKSISVYNKSVFISGFVNDTSGLDAILPSLKLVYELVTPTTETANPYQSLQTCYPDGTEEYVSTSIIPVGHNTTYLLDTTTQPVDNEFIYDNPPDVQDGQWLWVRTIYSDNSKTYLKTRQGFSGESGRSLSDTITEYTTAASSVNITENNMNNYTWSENVPNYSSSTPAYWVRVTNRYSNPVTVEHIIYKDNGITDAMATAAAANSTANQANTTANQANQTANSANQTANQANTNVTNLQTKLKYYWTNEVAHTNGSGGWTKPNYPAGTYAASGISGTTFDYENSSTYGYNTLYANGIKLRYNAINLGELTGSSLVFYRPSTTAQGSKGMELDSTTLKFYDATGTVAQATFGGTQATISGTINVYDGKIGNNANNYWYIGNYTDYNQNYSAIIKSKGTASIQLNETNTWRISTNRIHTAWAPETGTDAFKLHFPKFNDSKTVNKYWDFGLHLPISYSDKFLYIRNASGSETLDNLLNDLDDGGYDYWKYRFYISADGSLYAKNLYVLDDDGNTTQIGGTDGVYLLKSGGTITGNLEVNGTLTKGGKTVTYLTTTPTSGQILIADGTSGSIKTSGYTIATSVPSGAIFTDYRVKTEARGSTTMYLAGSNSSGTVSQGTLLTDSGVYIQTSSLSTNLVVPKINGYTLAAASAKGVDTSLTTSSTSTNLPTSKAVVDLIKQYLPLTGGSITGPVNFGDSVSIDDLTTGNLIVSGAGRFTNGLYGDLIGNADTATKVGNDLKIQLNGGTTEGTNQFTFNGSAAKTVNITKSSIGLGNVENKSSATIRGELTSSNVTTALGFTPYNATNPNGYTTNTGTVTSVKVQGSNGLTGSGTVTTSGTITLSHDDTSSQASSSNSGRTYIQSVTLDGYGHVTGLSTATETVTNTHNTAYLYAGASNGTANATTTNGNTYLILMDGGSATTRRKISGSGTVSVASNASGDITITGSAHPVALNGVSFANGIITFTKTDGNSTTIQTDNFVITQATGATALVGTDADHTPLSVNGPVKFTNGVPVTMRPSSASGKFLKDDGTWDTPGGTYSLPLAANGTRGGVQIGYSANGKNYPVQLSSEKMYVNVPWENTWRGIQNNLTSDSTTDSLSAAQGKALANGSARDSTKLPLTGGTMSGDLNFATIASWPVVEGETYPISSKGISWGGSSDGVKIFYRVDASDNGNLIIQSSDDASAKVIFSSSTSNGDGIILNSNDRTIYPVANNVGSLGTSSLKWANVYATTFSGALSGNASTATTFSSNASITLTGDTTGTASSTKGWSIATTTKKVSSSSTSSLSDFIDSEAFKYTYAGGNNSITDKPTSVDAFGAFSFKTAAGWYGQLLISSNQASGIYWRTATNLSGSWKKILDSNNYTDYTVTKTGSGASGTWGISISGTAAQATADASGNTITSTYVKKAGDTMTGALNTANGTANKIGDDSQLGDFNVGGTLGIQGLNNTTGIGLLQQGTTWSSGGNYAHITYDGTYVNLNKLFKITTSGNTVTIGSQNASCTHIYNSLSIPFIFNNSVLTTSGDLGSNSYPFTNVNIKGAYNMLVGNTQKAAMHYDSTLEAIVFSFA